MPTAEVALRILILDADTAIDTRMRDLLLAQAMRSSEVCGRTPIIVLFRAAAADGDDTPPPSALPAQARTLRPRARTDLGRAFFRCGLGVPRGEAGDDEQNGRGSNPADRSGRVARRNRSSNTALTGFPGPPKSPAECRGSGLDSRAPARARSAAARVPLGFGLLPELGGRRAESEEMLKRRVLPDLMQRVPPALHGTRMPPCRHAVLFSVRVVFRPEFRGRPVGTVAVVHVLVEA
jgi:hypothetical protein